MKKGTQPPDREVKILLVDDDANCRFIYSTALEHSGYDVTVAADGEEAVRLGHETAPDVVVMDLAMPKLDGHGALRALKDDAVTADTPVVAITGSAVSYDRQDLISEGFDEVIFKPCEPQRVCAAVRHALRSRDP
jgi:CheY-like chemotaxis protein